MKSSFQRGSLVLLVGSTCWWFGSSGADARSIHLFRLWYVANSSTLVSACVCLYIVDRNGGGSMFRWLRNVRACCQVSLFAFRYVSVISSRLVLVR
jgi:hypothetical protein